MQNEKIKQISYNLGLSFPKIVTSIFFRFSQMTPDVYFNTKPTHQQKQYRGVQVFFSCKTQ